MSDLHFHRREDDKPIPVDALPPGMTAEQLDFFTQQTERAVEKGVKEGVRQYRNRAVQGFIVLLIGLIALTYYQSHQREDRRALSAAQRAQLVASGRAVALTGCNRDFQTQQAFRATITTARGVWTDRPESPERTAALRFYDEVLRISPLPDCRKAENVITQDPDQEIVKINPFYPGAPYAPDSPTIDNG